MPQDYASQQSTSASDTQTDGSTATSDTGSNVADTTHETTSDKTTKTDASSKNGLISETWNLWIRMFQDPAEPDFKDGMVTKDNQTLFRLLIFVVLAASTITGLSIISSKDFKLDALGTMTLEALSKAVLFNKALLIPLVTVVIVALVYSVLIGPICGVKIDPDSAIRIFALRGLPFIPLWAVFYIWDPHRFGLAVVWYLTIYVLLFLTLRNVFKGIRKVIPCPAKSGDNIAPNRTACPSWKIFISLFIPLVLIGWTIFSALANHNYDSSVAESKVNKDMHK